jgi:hypothetical protein
MQSGMSPESTGRHLVGSLDTGRELYGVEEAR